MMMNKPFIWALHKVRRRLPAIALMTAAQVGHALFCVFFALGSRAVIDGAQSGDQHLFTAACIRQALIIVGILVCLTLQRNLRDRLYADLEKDWKQQLLHGLLHGEYSSVSAYHSGELINRLNNDVNKVNEGILNIIPNALAMIARLIAAVIVLGTLDAGFTLVILGLGLVVILVTALMRFWLKDLNKRVSHYDGKVSSFLQEVLEKLLMVQSMDVSDEVERRTDVLLDERYQIQRKRKNVTLFANTGISVMSYGAGFFALVWCAGKMLAGQISFGSLTAVIQLVNQLQSPFVGLSAIIPQYVAMIASSERLMELEKIPAEQSAFCDNPAEIYQKMDAVAGDDITFAYDADRVLDGADFSVPKGSFAVITGPSGIGKSTLLKLLLGIFRTESGELYFRCGEEILPISRQTRRLFAYVPQGNLLLSGSLRENLLIIKPNASEEEIAQAVYVSALDDCLSQLPYGLDTVLGENSAGLSEGQAQRLAIARAVLGGAPILLLDECTSALDAHTEQVVLNRIRELKDRTCIAVTHRPAAVDVCDLELQIEGNRIRMVKRGEEEQK